MQSKKPFAHRQKQLELFAECVVVVVIEGMREMCMYLLCLYVREKSTKSQLELQYYVARKKVYFSTNGKCRVSICRCAQVCNGTREQRWPTTNNVYRLFSSLHNIALFPLAISLPSKHLWNIYETFLKDSPNLHRGVGSISLHTNHSVCLGKIPWLFGTHSGENNESGQKSWTKSATVYRTHLKLAAA